MRKTFSPKQTVVTPLPVLIVGTYDAAGVPNAMNVAWGGQCGETHVALNLGHERQTVENIKLKQAFTVSFANRSNLVAADYVGIDSGLKVHDKLTRTGWTAVKSDNVDAPIFEQLPLTLECRLVKIQDDPDTGDLRIVGEVVGMSADESILTDGKIDLTKGDFLVYDSASFGYRIVGERVGNAFRDGLALR